MFSASSIRFHLLLSTAIVASLTFPGKANAQTIPQGGVFVRGSGTIPADTGQTTQTITLNTDRSVINWNSFDIGQTSTVNFTGSTADAVLNRVVTIDVSDINGKLMSDPSIRGDSHQFERDNLRPALECGRGLRALPDKLDLDDDDFMGRWHG